MLVDLPLLFIFYFLDDKQQMLLINRRIYKLAIKHYLEDCIKKKYKFIQSMNNYILANRYISKKGIHILPAYCYKAIDSDFYNNLSDKNYLIVMSIYH